MPAVSLKLFSGSAPRRWVLALVLLAYAGIVAGGAAHHEPWSDEADVWVMARESNFHDFLNFFSYTGHPPLWFAVVFPFARSGFPLGVMQVENALLAVGMAWVLLFRAPFALWVKVMLLGSLCLGYQYAVICRGYMLMTLLLFVLAAQYPQRLRQPLRYGVLLALLFNTEIFAMAPAALLAVWFAREWWQGGHKAGRHVAALCVACVGAVLAVVSLLPWEGMDDMQWYYRGSHVYSGAFLKNMRDGFLSQTQWRPIATIFPFMADVPYWYAVTMAPGVALLLLTAAQVGRSRWLLLLLTWLAWFYGIFTFVYFGAFWHAQLFLVFMIWTLWLHRVAVPGASDGTWLAVSLLPVLAIADVAAMVAYRDDYHAPYSGGADMALFIREAGFDGQVITSLACFNTGAVAGALPGSTYWYAGQERVGRYILWGIHQDLCARHYNLIDAPVVAKAQEGELIVLATREVEIPDGVVATRLHYSPGIMERFYLYSVWGKP